MKKGILYGIGAYVFWGFFPIYWKLLHHVPAIQLIGHRIIWSFLLLLVVILFTKQWTEFRETLNVKVLRIYTIAALLIGVNWFLYVWAVNANFIVETSLGYFINPLLSVLMGVVFFKRKIAACTVDSGYSRRYWCNLPNLRIWPPALYRTVARTIIWLVWSRQKTFTAWLALWSYH